MSKKIKIAAAASALFFLTACGDNNVGTTQNTSEDKISVTHLFTHEGCSAYRFYDPGIARAIHYVACDSGRGSNTTWKRVCGKGCIRTESVQAAQREGEP